MVRKEKDRSKLLQPNETKWKSVELENLAFTEENVNLDGFIGLEVLEDYNRIITTGKGKKVLKRKKPNLAVDESSESEESENEYLTPKRQVSKKGKKSKVSEESSGGKYVLKSPKLSPTTEDQSSDEHQGEIDDSSNMQVWKSMDVHETILTALAASKFYTPTEIQALTIPAAILGKCDIVGAAETGSGKTLAFGIPILNGIIELKRLLQSGPKHTKKKKTLIEQNPLYALILTPTRELCVQVRDHIKKIAEFSGINTCAIFGGMSLLKQKRVLSKFPEIVVATPGRLWDLLEEGDPHLNKVDRINYLVIDETDRMVEKGHFKELQLLVQRLNDSPMKDKRQTFVFSATLSLVHDLPDYLQKHNEKHKGRFLKQTPGDKLQSLVEMIGMNSPKIVDVTQTTGTAKSLTECRITCENEQKDYYLYYLLQKHPGRTIVFCNSIDCVRRLAQLFSILECKPLPLHANMAQRQRLKNLDRFRDNSNAILIATDVAARGLDIPNVQHVVHYQVPRTSENYVHRSGRTARANKEGIAILIMDQTEVHYYMKVFSTLGRSDDLPMFPVNPKELQNIKARVNLAREIDKLSLDARRAFNDLNWKTKTAEEADMILDDSDDNSDDDELEYTKEVEQSKKYIKKKRQQLATYLATPLFNVGEFKTKQPLINDPNPTATPETAISLMKTAINDFNSDKKSVRAGKILQKNKFRRLEK